MSTLPQILSYTPQVASQGAAGFNPRMDPGSPIAAGLSELGSGLVDLQQAKFEVELAQKKKRDAADAAKAVADVGNGAEQDFVTATEQAPADGSGVVDAIGPMVEKRTREALKGLSPQAQQTVRIGALDIQSQMTRRAISFEAASRVVDRSRKFEQASNAAGSAVELNPNSWQDVGRRQAEAINAAGLPPPARLKLLQGLDQAITVAAARGYATQDPIHTLERLKDPKDPVFSHLDGDQRATVERFAQAKLVDGRAASIVQAFETRGVHVGTALLATIDKDPAIPAELRDDVHRKVDAAVTQLRDQRRTEFADQMAGVEKAIATNTTTSDTVRLTQRLFDNNTFTPVEYASNLARIAASQQRASAQGAAAADIGAMIKAGIPLDPKNREQRESLNLAFQSLVKAEQPGSPTWQAQALALTHATRYLPEDAQSYLRSAARAPSPAIAAGAAQFYDALANNAPESLTAIDADTKAFASTAAAMIKNGASPPAAAEAARTIVFEAKPDLIEMRRKAFNQAQRGGLSMADQTRVAIPAYIGRDFGAGLFHANPIASDSLQADFLSQARSYYLKTGNLNLAQDLAWADLKHIYGPTNVNGTSMIVPFPVERFGLKPEDVRAEITDLLKTHPPSDGSTAADIHVVPDALTLSQVTDALTGKPVDPSYSLVTKSADLLTDEHGLRLRYFVPDYPTRVKRLQEERAAEDARALDSAKAHRSLMQEAADANRSGPARPF